MVTFTELQDDGALLSFEHQLHLTDRVGVASWSMDLEQKRFELSNDERTVSCTDVQFLGSAAPGPQSWLWAWANPGDYRADIMTLAGQVREFGERNGIPELTTAEVPFAALPGSPTDPALVTSYIMDVAKVITGHGTGYSAPVGGGTRFAFLLDHPEFPLPEPEPSRVARVLQQGLTEFRLHNHRRAVESYASSRSGLDLSVEGPHSVITCPGLTIEIRFDDEGLFSLLSAKVGDQIRTPTLLEGPGRH